MAIDGVHDPRPALDVPARAQPIARSGSLPLLAAVAAWLACTAWLRPLNLPEEGRYVGVAWEMLRSGNWLVPTENGLPFFHKPPLFYWLTAASMAVFGRIDMAARVAPLLAATLAAWGLYLFVRRWIGSREARLTLLVLATEPFFFAGAQFANLDMLVAALIAATILLAAHAILAAGAAEPHRSALVAAWACAALAVLAKGLIGLVLPSLVLLAWLLVARRPAGILRLLWLPGLAVFAALTVPWFVLVQREYPGFLHYFFVVQHFERFVASGFNNPQPWWFYIVVVPALTLPWSLWLAGASALGAPTAARAGLAVDRLMALWLLVILVFFSLPSSKPIGYMMPVLFPIAFLVGRIVVAIERGRPHFGRRAQAVSTLLAVALCLGAAIVSRVTYARDNTALGQALQRLRAPGEPVVFVGQYYFDVPIHAALEAPVEVVSDWADPAIAKTDNWRRELAEAAQFAPDAARALLVDAERGLSVACGAPKRWAVAPVGAETRYPALRTAERRFEAHGAVLWEIVPDCGRRTPAGRKTP